MAKTNMIAREKNRMNLVSKYQKERESIRNKLKKTSSFSEIMNYNSKIQRLPRNSARVRLRNRCWKTGRGNGYYRDFGLSRHVLREMAHQCLLPGVIKSSW